MRYGNLNKKYKIQSNISIITFQGKSYKLSIKPGSYNFRFNRSNKNIFVFQNLNIRTKKYSKKLIILNTYKNTIKKKLNGTMFKVRKYNTHTLRGIYTSNVNLNKRVGRISGYM